MNSAGLNNLKSLFWLRNFSILAQILCSATAIFYFNISLHITYIFFATGLLALFNIYTFNRTRKNKAVSDNELFTQLLADISILTLLLGLSGGASNPFAILYLLPLVISAIILPSRLAWKFTVITVALYSLIVFIHIPMPQIHSNMSEFNLHIIGMWLVFILSALVLPFFVVTLRQIINRQNQHISDSQKNELKNEQLVQLGIMAASTAHDMGTPLNNMTLIVDDIKHDEASNNPELMDKLDLIDQQILRCKDALKHLTQSTGNISLESGTKNNINSYVTKLINQWKLAHPDVDISLQQGQQSKLDSLITDVTLDHALVNILDNAAQVSPDIIIEITSDDNNLILKIKDFGPGLKQHDSNKIGKQKLSSDKGSMGIGLYLSHAIIERLGGSIQFINEDLGGLCTQILLPGIESC